MSSHERYQIFAFAMNCLCVSNLKVLQQPVGFYRLSENRVLSFDLWTTVLLIPFWEVVLNFCHTKLQKKKTLAWKLEQ